jgi:hypothetical protein
MQSDAHVHRRRLRARRTADRGRRLGPELPARFEVTVQTRQAIDQHLAASRERSSDSLFLAGATGVGMV